ncbi:hypothetical protein [Vibrio astriarenae]|uniref:hypothetical protein n=1 Tax=Vibrio astriarenae TaxID=1481923 RepID=UPI0037359FB8
MLKLLTLCLSLLTFNLYAFELTLIDKEGNKHSFTQEQLLSIEQHTFSTELPWIEGSSEFSGIYVTDLLNTAKLEMPEQLTFIALNDYKVTVPSQDFVDFKPIISIHKDGSTMSVRDKGPYWLVYPLSDVPELNEPDTHSKMIWQIKEIHF